MLEYTKTILQKVSFSPLLVRKELLKSFKWLNASERSELQKWVRMNYGSLYDEVFTGVVDEIPA